MADFSKQYNNRYMGHPEGDFDIDEEAKKLEKGTYVSLICEGYGFVAIGKTEKDEIKFALPIGNMNEVTWVNFEQLKSY
jgi:hypothetical protein